MKKRFAKRIMSLVLVAVMMVLTMSVSVISTSAYSYKAEYEIKISTAGSEGLSDDGFFIKINGADGTSTDWKLMGSPDRREIKLRFGCRNVDMIESISLRVDGDDSWYPEIFVIKKTVLNYIGYTSYTTIYGGRWIDSKEKTLSVSDNVYKLRIKTGDVDYAGTDCDVQAVLLQDNRTFERAVVLSNIHPDEDAFERADDSSFYIYTNDELMRVNYIRISSWSNKTAASDWYIDDIGIQKVQGRFANENEAVIDANQWDINNRGMVFSVLPEFTGTYDVTIQTSSCSGAGTDGDIYLQIVGTNDTTDKVCIDDYVESYTPGDNYEKGDTDSFRITFNYDLNSLGGIQGINVYNTGGGPGPDWHVDYIQIKPYGGSVIYQFNINDWIEDYDLAENKPYYCTDLTLLKN